MITYFNADISYKQKEGREPTYFIQIGGNTDISNDKMLEISDCVMNLLTALNTIPEKEREKLPGYGEA